MKPDYRHDPPPDLHGMWMLMLAIFLAVVGSVLFGMIGR